MIWIKNTLQRLKKPSVILSLVSQVVSILLLLKFDINSEFVLSIATIICSILVTLGILSNPDTVNDGYGDDILFCSHENRLGTHVEVNGEMVCKNCGCKHSQSQDN